jgi:hypothetical protein
MVAGCGDLVVHAELTSPDDLFSLIATSGENLGRDLNLLVVCA